MDSTDKDHLKPEDLKRWLRQEVRDLTRVMEVRIVEATDFVAAYASGEITADEAMNRLSRYASRWGDAIPGIHVDELTTNDEIVKRRDADLAESNMRRLGERPTGRGGRS